MLEGFEGDLGLEVGLVVNQVNFKAVESRYKGLSVWVEGDCEGDVRLSGHVHS